MPEVLPPPDVLLEKAVRDGIGSGMVVRVDDLRRGRLMARWVAGSTSREPRGTPVDEYTIFDLASLTKLYSVTLVLRLASRGFLDLDATVETVAPSLHRIPLARSTLRSILEHTSGAPAWGALYEKHDGSSAIRDAAAALKLGARGAHQYSDVGFLVLHTVLEQATRTPLDDLLAEEVLEPVQGAADLPTPHYRSVGAGDEVARTLAAAGGVAATEQCSRRGLLCGEVHDGNAWAMGGVATHAGLFGTAASMAALARAWWQAPRGFLPRSVRDAAWSRPKGQGSHVLGWDTVSSGYSSAGSLLSRRSVGHLGFTGTSMWIDPDRGVSVVFLTNRVHPTREDDRIRALRPRVHDAVAASVDAARRVG